MAELVELICQAQGRIKEINSQIDKAKQTTRANVERARNLRLTVDSLQRNQSKACTDLLSAKIKHETRALHFS